MAKQKFADHDEAIEAQTAGKAKVRDAKDALTSYIKENKLKRNVDYTNDKKHGAKITKLSNAVEKASEALVKINDAVKDLKPSKAKASKYDYPEGLTNEEKKKFRQAARSAAKPKKEGKEKKEKAPEAKAASSKSKGSKKKSKRSND